jgi:hypothetical protein
MLKKALDFSSNLTIIEAMVIDMINAELRELADAEATTQAAEYADEFELEVMMANSCFYGPDCDDCEGPWYWEL